MADMAPGYKSKSIKEVIHDLRDDRFWLLANKVARDGTRNDAANMLEKLCAAVQAERECIARWHDEQARKLRAEIAAAYSSDLQYEAEFHEDSAAAIRAGEHSDQQEAN
jgi:hypothetical protein